MRLARVEGENFRQFERFELAAAPRLNLITGANAAGKTTLLEALHCLGRGSSFRGSSPAELRGSTTEFWRLAAATTDSSDIHLAWNETGYRARTSTTADATILDLVQALPVQILEPGAHRLLEEGPGYRRRYLDWGMFHVEPRFFPAWRRYQRALRQRNRALKTAAPDGEVSSWDAELAQAGEAVHLIREQTLPRLHEHLAPLMQRLHETADWSLELVRGWNAALGLQECLRAHLARDRRMTQTLEGPHRAELRLKLGGYAVKHRISRGQQKLLVAALLLAQSALISAATGQAPLLLVDDFPAELGAPFQARLLDALRDSGSQVFLTAIETKNVELDPAQDALFHVEQGQVSRCALV
ncbi:MAG: DNA replication/repair protein RecF [Pseudomonadota bacterium]